MEHIEKVMRRLRMQAAEDMSIYKRAIASGHNPPYPQAAADLILLCFEFERLVLMPRQAGKEPERLVSASPR